MTARASAIGSKFRLDSALATPCRSNSWAAASTIFLRRALVAISSHDRLPSFGRSGASLQELRVLRTTNFSLFVGTVQQLASWRFSTRKRSILTRALCWHGKGDVRVDTVP